MKRFISLLLALVCLASVALAENIDFSAYTTDQLIEMASMIHAEVESRMACEDSPIASGTFVVGKDIKSGKYEVFVNEDNDTGVYVRLFSDEKTYQDYKSGALTLSEAAMIDDGLYWKSPTRYINLEEGNVLWIYGPDCFIKPANYSWQP